MRRLSRKTLSLVLVVIMILSVASGIGALAAREYAADVSILGATVDLKNPAYAEEDRIFVPLEELGGYMNISVERQGNAITVQRGSTTAVVTAGNMICTVDGAEVTLSYQPVEKNDVVYVSVDFFSTAFSLPVSVSEDFRSADITPNTYKVAITENDAAGVKASLPDEDTLVDTATGNDQLFWNQENFPGMLTAVYYKADLSRFKDKEIESASLWVTLARISSYNPSVTIIRTAPWEKGNISFNNRPEEFAETASIALPNSSAAAKAYVNREADVTAHAKAAMAEGTSLYVKLNGTPHRSKVTDDAICANAMGVNTTSAPYLLVKVKENYSFPVKTVETEETKEEFSYSKMALLRSLGVFTENDEFPLDLSEGVQRQEFVKYALRMRNTQPASGDGTQFFSDVPTDAPFYNDVMTAHSLGLVVGWEGIAFRPYDEITVGEAITIMGRMLNYNIYADERGGFTPGYFSAAVQGDLYRGTTSETQKLSFKTMFTLLEDALQAKMLNVRSYSSNGNAEYTFDENMTILTEYWNAEVIEGVVTANEYTSLAGGSGNEGSIEINSKKLLLSFKPYNDFLGYRVKAYYEKYEEKLLYMGIKEYDITEIDISDITGKSKSTNTISFNYEKENGSIGKESFSFEKDKKHIIYNGKSVTEAEFNKKGASLLDGDGGSIKLVGDSLAVITAYKTLVVFSVNASDEVIYDTYDKYDGTLRLSDAEYFFTDAKDNEVLLENIKNGDVISFAVSLDKKLVSGIVSESKVTGKIDMLENAGTTEEIITVGGNTYETVNRKEAWTKFIKLGTNATFYIDAFGRIVAMDAVQTEKILGYLLTVADSGISSLRKQLQAAIVVKGFEDYQVYGLADKVKIDGDNMDDAEKIKKHFRLDTDGNDTGDIITQGIIFDVDDAGNIKEIDTRTKGDNEEQENTLCEWTFESGARYHGEAIAEKFYLYLTDALGVMQYEPENPALEDYESITTLAGNKTQPFEQVYTIGKRNPEVKIAKLTGARTSGSVSDNETPVIVDRIVTAFDEDGLEVGKLYYYDGTTRNSVIVPTEYSDLLVKKYYTYTRDSAKPEETSTVAITTPDSLVTDAKLVKRSDIADKNIERGDVIRFAKNSKGELNAVEVLYEYSTKTLNDYYNDLAASSASEDRTMSGYTTMVEDRYVRLSKLASIDDDVDYKWFDINKFPSIVKYEVNSADVEVSVATGGDIRTFEKVPHSPTGMIMEKRYETYRGSIVLVDMAQPEGTGAYTLTYNLGEGGASYGKVPNTPVRCNPNGSVTVTNEVPNGKKDAVQNIAYEFSHWEDEDGNTVSDTIILTKNTVLTAQWNEIELPRYIYLKESKESTKEPIEIPVHKTNGSYTTEYPNIRNSEGNFYFTQEGFGYYNWIDGEGNEYNPYKPGDELLTLTEDLTLYPNWKPITDGGTIDGNAMELIRIKQTETEGVAQQSAVIQDWGTAYSSGGNWWLLAKVKIGTNWDINSATLKLTTRAGVRQGTTTGYYVPITKADYDAASAIAGTSGTIDSLDEPKNVTGADSSTHTRTATSVSTQTIPEKELTSSAYVNSYDGEYLYIAIQFVNSSGNNTNFSKNQQSNWKLTISGPKTN